MCYAYPGETGRDDVVMAFFTHFKHADSVVLKVVGPLLVVRFFGW